MKKIVYIDLDGVLVDFDGAVDCLTDEERIACGGEFKNIPGFFSRLKPMPGALEAFRVLSTVFDVYILSTAPWNNPSGWADKLQWVKKFLGDAAHKRLILTHHKNLNRGDYLIDDALKHGAREFDGELIRFGSSKYPDWESVLHYLLG